MIVAPAILITFAAFAGACALLAVHHSMQSWMTSLLNSLAHPHGNFLTRVALAPLALAARGVRSIVHRVSSDVSHSAAAMMHPLAKWMTTLAGVVLSVPREIGALATDVEHAFADLFNDVIHPIDRLARRALELARHSISLVHRAERDFTRGIDRLHRDLSREMHRLFHGIDAFVRHTVWPRLRTAERDIAHVIDHALPAIRREERALSARVKALEKLLAAGAITALLLRVLARRFPWLFCRNVASLAKRACSLPHGLMQWLLGAGAAMFAFSELCNLVTLVGSVAARVLPVLIAPLAQVDAALCGGEHKAALPLPLAETQLPSVSNPLPLG